MKIHLTHQAAESLVILIKYLLDKYPAEDKAEKILDALVNQVRLKIRNRIERGFSQSGYTFTLSIEHSLAFDLWMDQMRPSIPPLEYGYEQNIALQITNESDKIYG